MRVRELPPLDILNDLLGYNPETGELRWKKNRGRKAKAGDVAGSITSYGYRYIKVKCVGYMAHRVCWALHTNQHIPTDVCIDHINGNRDDNRACNLRLVTYSENSYNRYQQKTTIRPGVCIHKHRGKFAAYIHIGKKRLHLGYYNTEEDAITARLNAEQEHNIFVR